jgi:predicted small secreted protein
VKRSRAVPLTLVAASAALSACAQRETMQCVDKSTGRAVAESLCVATNAPVNAADTVRTRQAGGIPPIFLWYFGGRMVNGLMSGGAYRPLPGRQYQSPTGYRWNRDGILRTPRGAVVGAFGGARAAPGSPSGTFGRSTPTARGGFGRIGGGRFGGG